MFLFCLNNVTRNQLKFTMVSLFLNVYWLTLLVYDGNELRIRKTASYTELNQISGNETLVPMNTDMN